MLKYSPSKNVMWDAWFVRRGTEIHAFYLQNGFLGNPGDPAGWAIGHAVSHDALHWEEKSSLLPPLFDEGNPEDFHSKFTGCAVNRDDVCYLFYTMRQKQDGGQRLGVAISHDWETFEPYKENPIIVNDSHLLISFDNLHTYDWNIVDCRDLIVVEDGEGGYLGYFAAAADVGRRCPCGVIVMARSRDLLHWGQQKIVYTVDHHGVLEVPDVFRLGNKWILTCLSGMNYSGRAVSRDEYASNVTIFASADTPDGPFLEGDENILIGGPEQSGFTCRSLPWENDRLLYYIDRAAGKTALSLPKVLKQENGRLTATFCPLLENELHELSLPAPVPEQNSFAWRTFGGDVEKAANGYRLWTSPKDYHAVSFPVVPGDICMDATIQVQAVGGGLFFRTGQESPCILFIEPEKKRLALFRLYSFNLLAARCYPFVCGEEYTLRCLLIDGVIEVYVNNVLLLQCGLPSTQPITSVGIAADRGEIIAQNIHIYRIGEEK